MISPWTWFRRWRAYRAYEKAKRQFEIELVEEKERQYQFVSIRENRIRLGLPAEMPEASLRILQETMALDRIGPRRPRIDHFYQGIA